MGAPTIADPASMVGQFYDAQLISAAGAAVSATVTPSKAGTNFWRAIQATTGGTITLNTLGVGGKPGTTGLVITFLAGQIIQLAVTAVTASAALGVIGYY